MKYCPQCNRRFSELWLTFCTDDGSLLRDELTPPADTNWDPRIRPTQYDDPSESPTQWLPPETQPSSGWMSTGERGPVERPWQPPPAPPQPRGRSGPSGVAIASLIIGFIGVMAGLICWMPVPGIVAVILGIIALRQMKTAPDPSGRGFAIAGIVMGSINLAFFAFGILWFVLSLVFG